MTLLDTIKDLPLEDKAAILYELQEDKELNAFLGMEKNDEWLQQQLSSREEKIKNGEAHFTSREQLNNLLSRKYEV
jgi:hypothetical protein